jgi:aerobic-type carbon monoxide dehydrogenase small subunit (CoxS/CutS family)
MMKFLLNGEQKEYDGNPELDLMTYLREHEGILSPKNGCAPQAACGCCAVQLDEKAVLSCVIKMSRVEGKQVTTIEGLGAYRQHVFANAFVNCGGVQCGFCIPGIVMQANVLIGKNPGPSRTDVEKVLTPHLCRCTGFYKAYQELLASPAWQRASNFGGRPQRLLWASTGTKDPNASDTLYIETLASPFTVNTMPEGTLNAFADHGEVGDLMAPDGGDCELVLAAFAKAGVDVDALAARLQDEGAKSFVKSWDELIAAIESKSAAIKKAS